MKRVDITSNARNAKQLFPCMFIALTLLFSCNQEVTPPDFTADDTESASSDALEDSYLDEGDDLSAEGFATNDAEGGKVSSDERLACATLSHDGTKESGTLRLDFGDGCKDPRGNVRRGAIVVVHEGRWNISGTRWRLSYEGYSINGIGIEGTREITVISVTDSLATYDVVLTGGRITWVDGRIATREVNRRREHERHGNHLLDRLIIYGTAQVTFRNGRGYSIEILERLIYRRACAAEGVILPVSGVKLIKHGDRELKVDYGDGTCDNIVTLINKNGRSIRYEVGK
jgi:hypothetical protein